MSQPQPPWNTPGQPAGQPYGNPPFGNPPYGNPPFGGQPGYQPTYPPSYQGESPYGPPGYGPQANPSNGLGVASLVLSILWLFGVGSLLAVIFGTRARRRARQFGGSSGLGTAGMVIGIVGLVGAVLFWILAVAVSNDLKVTHLQPGQTATFADNADTGGIKTVTVFGVTYPFKSQDSLFTPGQGQEFATADVQVCAGPSGAQSGPDPLDFDMVFSGSQTVSAELIADPRKPSLNDVNALAANQCTRGYLTFEIAAGSTPIGVRYGAGLDSTDRHQWAVNGSS
jgi:hypothetical protein